MVGNRIRDTAHITSERFILEHLLTEKKALATNVLMIESDKKPIFNCVPEEKLGLFRPETARKAATADTERLKAFRDAGLPEPSFFEAGPRVQLRHDPRCVRAAIVTTGGLAPGLNCVIHSIVKRHCKVYSIDKDIGSIFGVYDSFRGLCTPPLLLEELDPETTENWIDQGGSQLGSVRHYHGDPDDKDALPKMAELIARNLTLKGIDILYVIGGDGSLKTAHYISQQCPKISIVGIPKTMDNDILWVWQSFGFDTAVEQASRVINVLHSEADSTRRICVIELFGAESGFVAANAALASGHVDAVLIPEVFKALTEQETEPYLDSIINHIANRIIANRRNNPHAVIVLAEGVATVLKEKSLSYKGRPVEKREDFLDMFAGAIHRSVQDARGEYVPVFTNEPRHHIRAVPANAHDQIYCERLGALAVDNALAGYRDFMVSQWLTEFVLVPLSLVEEGKKCIPIHGMFWKQVVCSTGQPLSPAEYPTRASNKPMMEASNDHCKNSIIGAEASGD